jgi:alpha-glucosidase
MLYLYRQLIGMRRGEPALEVGRFKAVTAEGDVLAYFRSAGRGASTFLIALNLGQVPLVFHCPEEAYDGTTALSTFLDRSGEPVHGDLQLRADEGMIIRLAN